MFNGLFEIITFYADDDIFITTLLEYYVHTNVDNVIRILTLLFKVVLQIFIFKVQYFESNNDKNNNCCYFHQLSTNRILIVFK